MKHFYLSLITAVAGLSLQAQTLTQANHAPAAGDINPVYQCDSTGVVPGASGSNVMWNFGSVVSHTNIAKTYTTNTINNASYPAADLVQFSSGSDVSYYKSSATDLQYFGGAISISTVVSTLNYSATAPAIRGVYPMSLNTTSTTGIAGTINFTISNIPISANFTGSSNVTADGTGSLTLPGGAAAVFTNVIRVVSSQTLNFSVAFPPTTGTLTQKTYDYYSVGVKVPLLTIATSTIVNAAIGSPTQTMVFMQKDYLDPALGIHDNKLNTIVLDVFPNPSSSVVNLTTESLLAKEVLIYDITGKMVDKQNFVEGKIKLDVSSYNNGIYIYKAVNAANQTLKTGKLTVTH